MESNIVNAKIGKIWVNCPLEGQSHQILDFILDSGKLHQYSCRIAYPVVSTFFFRRSLDI
jgi:hypothetical protein